MILHTSMPLELVFPPDYSALAEQQCIVYQGVQMLVTSTSDNGYEVCSLLSTNPYDYLTYSPGMRLE